MAVTTTKANDVTRTYRKRLGAQEQRIVQVAEAFAPETDADWSTVPTTQDEALNTLASESSGAAQRTVKVEYDFANEGGAQGTIGLGVELPDNAVVLYVMQDVLTAPDSAGDSGTIKCVLPVDGDLTVNITADAGTSGLVDGVPDFTAANAVKCTAAREVSVTIGTEDLTSGKVLFFITYAVSE